MINGHFYCSTLLVCMWESVSGRTESVNTFISALIPLGRKCETDNVSLKKPPLSSFCHLRTSELFSLRGNMWKATLNVTNKNHQHWLFPKCKKLLLFYQIKVSSLACPQAFSWIFFCRQFQAVRPQNLRYSRSEVMLWGHRVQVEEA